MAKVVFFNVPAHGHINPTLATVAELVSLGEKVYYYASLEFKEKIEKTGAIHRPYPTDLVHDEAEMTKNGFDMAYMLMQYNQSIIASLLEEVKALQPDYVIQDALCIWAKIISHRLGIPGITTIPFLIVNTKSLIFAPQRLLWPTTKMMVQGFKSLLKYFWYCRKIHQQYGLAPYNMLFEAGGFNELNLQFTSSKFQPMPHLLGESFRFVGLGINLGKSHLAFPYVKKENHPIIYISLGTIMSVRQNQFYRLCFEAFAQQPVQVIMAVGKKTNIADLGAVPDNFIVENYVPQLAVLQHTDVFITHAGMNSIQEGFYYGVPLVAIPQSFEQRINANRIEEAGAGIYVSPDGLSPAQLLESTQKVLANSSIKENVAQLKEELLSSGGYKKAANEIIWFTRNKGIQ